MATVGERIPIRTMLVAAAIAAAVFIFDLLTPLGVAAGVPYVALVLAGHRLPDYRHLYLLAALGTLLTIAGYALSPEGSVPWIVLTNRGLAIFAIWSTAMILASRRRAKTRHDNVTRELEFQKRALDEHAIVSIADIKGNIVYVNEKFCTISGYSREDLIGKNHRMLKSDVHPLSFYEDLWRTIASGRTWHGEIKNRKNGGGYYWVQATIVPFLNEKGFPFQYVSIRTDITERKHSEELAKAASEAKSEFLASMSHELRTPMNAVLGFAQMLKYGSTEPLSETQKGYVDNILQGGGYLMELINHVLELSRIETGQISLNISDVSPRDVIDDCIILISGRADKDGIEILDQSYSSDLPTIRTDRTRLTQALLNLVSNAVKYNRENGTVTLSCQVLPGGLLRFRIDDTGSGIPEDKYSGLFKAFDRLGREARNIEGIGVGLTITKRIVELLGGQIGFESTLGQGSSFWIDIPISREQSDIRPTSGDGAASTASPSSGHAIPQTD